MKRILYAIGMVASVVSVIFFVRALSRHWGALSAIHWDSQLLLACVFSMLIYVSTYIISALAWQRILLALGGYLRAAHALRVLMLSQIAKYLPGNVAHHIGRVALARGAGVATDVAIGSMLLETLLVIAAGAVASLPAFALLRRIVAQRWTAADSVLNGAAIPAAFLLFLVVCTLAAWYWCRRRPNPIARSPRAFGALAIAWCGYCLSFVLGGSALFLVCSAISVAPGPWMATLGVYAAAWLLGFLVPGSPAGLGVREVVLLLGLTPIYGASSATMATGLLRLVTVAGDGLAFLVGTIHRRKTSIAT
jgi:uncharacterized membrane protein YbhN (UPF0104 family)